MLKNNKEIAILSAKSLDDKKAGDIVCIDVSIQSSFADYLVIGSAGSERQLNALVTEVEDNLEKEGVFPKRIEGKAASGWILMDFGDVIINVFTEEMREKYNIEKIWADCEKIELNLEA